MWSVATCFLLQEGGGGDAGSRGHRDEPLIPRTPKCLAFPAQGEVLATSPTGERWVLPAQSPGCETPSRSAIFLSASRRQGHFSSKMQPGRKGSAGSPSGPALHVPGASQPAALLTPPCAPGAPKAPSFLQPTHPVLGNSMQRLLPLCEDERTKWSSSPKSIPPGLGSKPPVCLKPLTVPGPPAAPVNEEGGFLAVCRWMTSASWTHSSVHPSLTARHPLSCSFTPSPPHHSLPLIHTAHQAPPGPPVQTLS